MNCSKNSEAVYKPTKSYGKLDDFHLLTQVVRKQTAVRKIDENDHQCSVIMSGGYVIHFWCANLWYAFASRGIVVNTATGEETTWDGMVPQEKEFMKLASYLKQLPVKGSFDSFKSVLEGHKCKRCNALDTIVTQEDFEGNALLLCTSCAKNQGGYLFANSFRFINQDTVELLYGQRV